MDLETENRLAAMLLAEARRLQLQAEKEGVHAYLQPNIRHRPNSRFLTATVLGVQQANRAVEVEEMWRSREKELELERKTKRLSDSNYMHGVQKRQREHAKQRNGSSTKHDEMSKASRSSNLLDRQISILDDDCGLGDDEIEQFLHSRVKRGRGAIGSRMDEPGPYLLDSVDNSDTREKEEWERRVMGPIKPQYAKILDYGEASAMPDDVPNAKKHGCSRDKRKEDKRLEKKKRKRREKHSYSNSRSRQRDD